MFVVTIASAQVKQETEKTGIATIDQIKTEPITVGYSLKMHSNLLNEERTIMIALPDNYHSSTKRYPVLYITDGQWNFIHTSQAISSLSSNGVIPQMILIAVQTLDFRDRDLVVTRNEESKMGGGADKFLSFIKSELIPFIDVNYRTSDYRALAGTSFGGIFVMHAFITDPHLFKSYLALSPSMWWDYGVLLKRTEAFLAKNPMLDNYLYITVANEGLGMGVNALARILELNSTKGLMWKFIEYPQEIHGTVPYKGTYDGLKFIFSDWSSEPIHFATTGHLLSPGDSVLVKMNSFAKTIRYTMNNSEPGVKAALYEKPLVITKPTVIKAIPYYGDNIPGNVDSLVIKRLPKLAAELNLPDLQSGLDYSYYEGTWDKLPDLNTQALITSGVAANFKMIERKKEESFAFRYSGFIDIPKDNIYTFYLSSDDGSRLLIGDQFLIDNDGLHDVVEKNGKAHLQQGKHRIDILYFQKGGGFNLSIQYESADIAKQKVPETSFYCRK
jgi:predicted alpha/beta superfamily hydrolase